MIFSLWQIRVMQTDCPMKPLDRLNCTKKKVMHAKGSVLLSIGGTAQVFERQTELQSCTVPSKRVAQVENFSVQKFVRTRVNVV